ncbi:hypothetical protein MSAN_00224800 [Mycena sanguinolenta]|uniref:Uncharacterized protein n=1 Tax=Mycena sanguinolenta TaxID=230812 RepID=A0A8H7DJT2_9AGAR|nr:hypothetical protein MSAN_00224800 [Mycena sanguinolenta]
MPRPPQGPEANAVLPSRRNPTPTTRVPPPSCTARTLALPAWTAEPPQPLTMKHYMYGAFPRLFVVPCAHPDLPSPHSGNGRRVQGPAACVGKSASGIEDVDHPDATSYRKRTTRGLTTRRQALAIPAQRKARRTMVFTFVHPSKPAARDFRTEEAVQMHHEEGANPPTPLASVSASARDSAPKMRRKCKRRTHVGLRHKYVCRRYVQADPVSSRCCRSSRRGRSSRRCRSSCLCTPPARTARRISFRLHCVTVEPVESPLGERFQAYHLTSITPHRVPFRLTRTFEARQALKTVSPRFLTHRSERVPRVVETSKPHSRSEIDGSVLEDTTRIRTHPCASRRRSRSLRVPSCRCARLPDPTVPCLRLLNPVHSPHVLAPQTVLKPPAQPPRSDALVASCSARSAALAMSSLSAATPPAIPSNFRSKSKSCIRVSLASSSLRPLSALNAARQRTMSRPAGKGI